MTAVLLLPKLLLCVVDVVLTFFLLRFEVNPKFCVPSFS